MNATFIILLLLAYVCGSIPFAKLVGRAHGIDIQKHGSGNIGFANTVRVLGWKAGFLVLPGDVLKGYLPVLIARQYLNGAELLAVALATILGHIFPVWLKFKGGKGIATGLGVTLALNPLLVCFGLATYLIGFAVYKKSAPSSLTAATCIAVLCLLYYPQYAVFYLLLAVLVFWTHRTNLRQLFERT